MSNLRLLLQLKKEQPAIYLANPGVDQTTIIEPITKEWLDAYEKRIKAPV